MNLLDTPIEIFLQIFENINDSAVRSNLSRSCRRLHEFIRPILYTEFVALSAKTTFLFIRTILQNPSLAQQVHRLVLATSYPDYNCHVPFAFAPALFKEDWSLLKQQLKAYCTTREEFASGGPVRLADPFVNAKAAEFFRKLTYQRTDDLSACLLLLLPNLESVQARYYGGNGLACSEVMQMARNLQVRRDTSTRVYGSYAPAFTLSRLKESSGVTGTFELPSMRKFSFDLNYQVPPNLKHCLYEIQIKDLTLRSSGISALDAGKILKNCLHLDRFYFSFKYPKLQGLYPEMRFEPAILFEAMAHLTNTLQSLALIDLDAAEEFPSTQGVGCLNTSIEDGLSEFHKLRSLEISRDTLFGKSTYSNLELAFNCGDLPESLTHVILYDSDNKMVLNQTRKTNHVLSGRGEASAASSHQELMAEKFKKCGIALSYACL